MQAQDGVRVELRATGRGVRIIGRATAGVVATCLTVLPPTALALEHDADDVAAHERTAVRLLAPADPGSGGGPHGTDPHGSHRDAAGGPHIVRPTPEQRSQVEELGGDVRWTSYGTPASLSFPADGAVRPDVPARAGPAEIARGFVTGHAHLFRLTVADAARLRVASSSPLNGTRATVVTLRQAFRSEDGPLPAVAGGLITVGVTADGRVGYVSSSAYGSAPGPLPHPALSPEAAWIAAARTLGRAATTDMVRPLGATADAPGWQRFSVIGLAQVQHVRLGAAGIPGSGGTRVRPVYESNVVDVQNGDALAVTVFVDAVTGEILLRHNRTNHARPARAVPAGCPAQLVGCGVRLNRQAAAPSPLLAAMLYGPVLPGAVAYETAPRPFDVWMSSQCDIARLESGGTAAQAYIHSLRRDLRTWMRRMGVPDTGETTISVQAGAPTGGYPTYLGRNNAVEVTLQSGLPGVTAHYLFEPVAGQWYGPCADGALDASLIAHEYAHSVTEQLVGGPDTTFTTAEGEAMAESWSDLLAAEYLYRRGAASRSGPVIGEYVSGNADRGIRNHPLGANTLNASNLGYDDTGSWGSDGEIWSAVNWDLRRELGARTWTRLLIDSLFLQQGGTTMTDGRDALLAADRLRYGGRHADRIWQVFARRGLGRDARTGAGRLRPSFSSPVGADGALQVEAVDARTGQAVPVRVHVGRYGDGGSVPVADTNPDTRLPSRIAMAPGRYELTWTGRGYGMGRARVRISSGTTGVLRLRVRPNLASSAAGGRAYAGPRSAAVSHPALSGAPDKTLPGTVGGLLDGVSATTSRVLRPRPSSPPPQPPAPAQPAKSTAPNLIDDSEAYGWTGRDLRPDAVGSAVTVDLAGDRPHRVDRVVVSALPRPVRDGTGAPNRFATLRRFAIEVTSGGAEAGWRRIYTSPPDAFPAGRPRPVAPDLTFRAFDVPDSRATQVRLLVLDTQCTGNPAYHGQQSSDPLTSSDCRATETAHKVTIAELMVY